jgi:hypothetical protein
VSGHPCRGEVSSEAAACDAILNPPIAAFLGGSTKRHRREACIERFASVGGLPAAASWARYWISFSSPAMSPSCGLRQGSIGVDVRPAPGSTCISGRPAVPSTLKFLPRPFAPAAPAKPFSSKTIPWAPSSPASSLSTRQCIPVIPTDHRCPVGTRGRSHCNRCRRRGTGSPFAPGLPLGATERRFCVRRNSISRTPSKAVTECARRPYQL